MIQLAAAACLGFGLALLILPPWKGTPQSAPAVVAPVAPVKKPMAELLLATGSLEVQPAGMAAWQPIKPGGALEPGARVRTGPGAICELRTSDGSEVRLNSDTELVFQSNRLLELVSGQVWSSVRRAEAPFEVKVPDAKVTALGTKFDLSVSPRRTSRALETAVTVLEGVTRVAGAGREVLVRSGQRTRIEGGRIEDPREEDVVLATSWVLKLLQLKGPENEELASRLDDLLAYIGEGKVKFLAVQEIKDLGESCVEPLLRYLQSSRSRKDPDCRVKAASIVSEMAPRWAVYDLIKLLADQDRPVRSFAAKGLERITGEAQGATAEDWGSKPWSQNEAVFKKWLSWWEEKKAQYPSGP